MYTDSNTHMPLGQVAPYSLHTYTYIRRQPHIHVCTHTHTHTLGQITAVCTAISFIYSYTFVAIPPFLSRWSYTYMCMYKLCMHLIMHLFKHKDINYTHPHIYRYVCTHSAVANGSVQLPCK